LMSSLVKTIRRSKYAAHWLYVQDANAPMTNES
jgi:hypothetical protein